MEATMSEQFLSEVDLAVAEGTIVTWRTDETIPVGFGTIQVVPVWRFLLEMEPRT
jgi:predicted AAA+ superfamily ATPase